MTMWAARNVALKFALGERTLFRSRLRLAVATAHFTELAEDQFCNFEQWNEVPADVDGVLVRSQPIGERLQRLKISRNAIRYVPAQYQRYYLEFGQPFAQYLQKFSSGSRQKRKKELKKFAESSAGKIDFREYRSRSEVVEFLRHGRELSRRTFQERLLDAGLPSSEEFRERILQSADEARVRAYMLFHAGRPASYLLNEIRDPGIVMSLYTGYDPQFRALSPGTIVYYLALERMFAETGLSMLDFTEGEGLHKQYFATGSRLCADIYFLRPTLRAHTLLYSHAAVESFSRGAATLLERVGLKAKVRKLIRART